MSDAVVVDASLSVKWFKEESGSEAAMELLVRHVSGDVDIHTPAQCLGELLAVCARWEEAPKALEAWVQLGMARIIVHDLDDALVREAESQMATLECDFYDALAPALAVLIDATLYSADSRAHGTFPGAVLIG